QKLMPVASVFRSHSLAYLLFSLLFLSNLVESYFSSTQHKRIDGEHYEQHRNVIEYNKRDANGTLTCNEREDICDLGYDQVTHIGTHNSGAYDLAFDCDQIVSTCLDSSTACTKQLSSCLASYPLYCSAAASICKQWHPSWSHFFCDGFDAICKKTDMMCYLWEGICSDTTNVCALWGNACENGPPEWFLGCLWENNAGMDVMRQLEDGIRYLDLDTCQTKDTVVICHGMGLPRALGHSLDDVFSLIRSFLLSHPNEVVSLGFGDYDGNATFIASFIQSKLSQYFTFPNGTSLFLSRTNNTQPWPTLREMIESNRRVVVWFEWLYNDFGTQKREDWIHSSQYWMTKSYDYAYAATTPQKLNESFVNWCGNADEVIASNVADFGRLKWQIVDDVVSYDPGEIVSYLQSRTRPSEICLQSQANQVNFGTLDFFADFCVKKFDYIFRITVDYYWKSNLFEVAKKLNDWNVERVKGWV
ncbi:6151_t:CDS:2, partial [Paraglomus brasilianum]